MNRRAFRLVVVLAIVSIAGILFVQFFWMGKAFDLRNKQFEHNVNIALLNVTSKLCEINSEELLPDPIEQLSSNYFIVNINNRISPSILESILKSEFTKREIADDFEYGIFDCANEEMVYGNYVNLNDKNEPTQDPSTFPKLNKDAYYFGVYFPNKPADLVGQMGIWAFSSLILLVVVIFFGYTLFVILKQKRLSEIQKDFINNMTHEFKTPIATIAVSAQVLQSSEIARQPERLANYAGIIEKEAKRLQNQVDRVLQMATVEKEQINLKIEKTNISELIKGAIENARLAYHHQRVNIQFEDPKDILMMSIDKLHMTNVLDNLLDNAIKYCGKQPIVNVNLSIKNHHVLLSIKDNGIGIDNKYLPLVFNKFYRVPTGNLHDVKGFGLGLYYVKIVVEAHRGKVQVQSDSSGSIFMINLPQGI